MNRLEYDDAWSLAVFERLLPDVLQKSAHRGRTSSVSRMRRVVLESPFAGDTASEIAANKAYARACLLDCLRRGEAPLASHLLYTQVLNDARSAERQLGIAAGLAWAEVADATVVYVDRGISAGMRRGIAHAKRCGRPVEKRHLNEINNIQMLHVYRK